ncbi:hypothetical protein LJC45_02095 [Alistipes sp. OttesenSCG-928-B03]|nr:hypothetical protein [Alistipes sp. OttesenSCG-928-B03]
MIAPPGVATSFWGYLVPEMGSRELVIGSSLYGNGEPVALIVNMDHVEQWASTLSKNKSLDAYKWLDIYYTTSGHNFVARRYEIVRRRSDAVRLCWVNEYGSVDYHTFAVCANESVAAIKSRIYTGEGYRVLDSRAQKSWAVRSEYMDAEGIAWLRGLLSSPRVWIAAEGGMFTPVDVMTDSVTTDASAPASLKIALREAKLATYQNL